VKKFSLFLVLSIPGLILLSCGKALAIAHHTYKNLLNSYTWFPEVWNILGWLGSIMVLTGVLYAVAAWTWLAVLNYTGKQR
jgi:hypothetical protein